MEKYTIEYLEKAGNRIKLPKGIKYRTVIECYEQEASVNLNLSSFGTITIHGKKYIKLDNEFYTGSNWFLVPISEFERMGMIIKEEIPQYFAVKNDKTKEFKGYLKWLNKKYSVRWIGMHSDYFYGYCGYGFDNGTFASSKGHIKSNVELFESAKEFMELVNKQENKNNNIMEKPKTFWITGKKHQLEAIWEDLKELGYYSDSNKNYELKYIGNNYENRNIKDLNKFKSIFLGDTDYSKDNDITFNLPEDYSKALKHCEEAINSPYWNIKQEIKYGVGGKFDVAIKKEGIFHGSDNITKYVEELVKHFSVEKLDKYKISVKNAEFSVTGCQNVSTTLQDWKDLWNKYQEHAK